MILVDSAVGSWELQSLIQRYGVSCEKDQLDSADAAFEGSGPDGNCGVGIERKKMRDFLDCINTGRYSGHQNVLMKKMYRFRFVVLEGFWKPEPQSGMLLQGIENQDHTMYWTPEWGRGMGRVMYHKLRMRFSMMMSGVLVLPTYDITHTAHEIVELYHWFQKPWHEHTSLMQMHDRAGLLPTLNSRPSVTRQWAFALDGIGLEKSADAERIFRSPKALANGDELDWMKIPGVGVETAQKVVRQIMGVTR